MLELDLRLLKLLLLELVFFRTLTFCFRFPLYFQQPQQSLAYTNRTRFASELPILVKNTASIGIPMIEYRMVVSLPVIVRHVK